MPIEIIVPRLGWSMEEGAFVAWLKKDGELVRAGEALFSIEGDKAVQEIESIDSGVLRIAANCPKPGESIHVGDVLGHLVSSDETAPESVQTKSSGFVADPRHDLVPVVAEPPRVIESPAVVTFHSLKVPTISPRAVRVAAELGVDWTTVTGTGRTGRIRESDIRAAANQSESPRLKQRLSPQPSASGSDSTVLVTGGCGFIGTWVVRELLERGLRVVVLDAGEHPRRWERVIGSASEKVALVRGTLVDRVLMKRTFDEHDVTHIIHLAALLTPACQADPWEACNVNVLGSVALFEEARLRAGRIRGFAYASSVAVFGPEPDHAIASSVSENRPPTFYGAFKKSVEIIAEQYWTHFQISSVGIRPQVAYGPEREVGLTAGPSLAARAAARGESFCVSYTGRVGYDYVEDVARAFVRGALETPPGALVVDLLGEAADVEQILAAIAEAEPKAATLLSVKGPPIPAHTPPNPRFISELYPDWKTTSLAEGISKTVHFYRCPKSG